MVNRRRFLTLSSLSGLFPSLAFTTQSPPLSYASGPLVVSTWNQPKANAAAEAVLSRGGRALDAVEAGARVPEADPNDTSVGYGGLPDRDGRVTLDACIMDERGNCGSVTYLEHIMHAISVARAVMEKTPHVMISGEGALKFALSQGFKKENLLTKSSEAAWREWMKTAKYKPQVNIERHDTIGMLAMDTKGDFSGACTTSGLAYKMNGRVGDSPIIGSGLFVDNTIGAACATGLGELVMRTCGSFLAVELMRQGKTPQQACEEVINRIVKGPSIKDGKYVDGQGNLNDVQVGVLAVNRQGEIGAYSIQTGFNYTVSQNGRTEVREAKSFLSK
ncbi:MULTISPECIES: N(4)-(beta-N-acetylglucosaminyl)-L-asparaginase [Spirosoma]|uniref:Glycosylasparaginase n=1 Tax=Spirosoma sordidisoli TaxID=2502893 RepID=A0A4Q2UJW7_9BACT|nr:MULTISPECIES: N(4)-(beta-N-acetylglucosaminyl)-L-asparaginase [Spirosoma]RYC67795.1 glycosylasparaginase [Spirosoma sordidisoli]